MPDYDWFSDKSIAFAVDGMTEEAKKWHQHADAMGDIKARAANQTLTSAAFCVADVSTLVTQEDLSRVYGAMQSWLTELFAEAVVQFDSFGEALIACAKWYRNADENSAQDFDEIASSM